MAKPRRIPHDLIVLDREDGIFQAIEALEAELGLSIRPQQFGSALDILSDNGRPKQVAGVAVSAKAAGPFFQDILGWSESNLDARIPVAVFGADDDTDALDAVLGRDHVRWYDQSAIKKGLQEWLPVAVEVGDVRRFLSEHRRVAQELHEGRTRLFRGEVESFTAPEGPPCGPPLPTSLEEIQSLRDARAQYERGMIRAAVRETGSLKDASVALGISYTSLWRRMRQE